MQNDLPPRDSLGKGALHRKRHADAHDPEEGGEHEVPGHQPVPRSMFQPPVSTRAVVHKYHEHYRYPVTVFMVLDIPF